MDITEGAKGIEKADDAEFALIPEVRGLGKKFIEDRAKHQATVDVERALLSMDAMFTQRAIATLIIDKKADYLMGLKGNQSSLLDEIQYYFEDATQVNFEGVDYDRYYNEESGHGRVEKRTIQVVCDLKEWLPQIEQ